MSGLFGNTTSYNFPTLFFFSFLKRFRPKHVLASSFFFWSYISKIFGVYEKITDRPCSLMSWVMRPPEKRLAVTMLLQPKHVVCRVTPHLSLSYRFTPGPISAEVSLIFVLLHVGHLDHESKMPQCVDSVAAKVFSSSRCPRLAGA